MWKCCDIIISGILTYITVMQHVWYRAYIYICTADRELVHLWSKHSLIQLFWSVCVCVCYLLYWYLTFFFIRGLSSSEWVSSVFYSCLYYYKQYKIHRCLVKHACGIWHQAQGSAWLVGLLLGFKGNVVVIF